MVLPRSTRRRHEKTYSDDFRSDEGEGGLGHNCPPAQEAALRTTNTDVLREWTRVLPVSEANSVMGRSSTEVKDDAEDLWRKKG